MRIMSKSITILKGQSLADIAIQEGGSIEAMYDLALANDLTLDEALIEGNGLLPVDVRDVTIVNFMKRQSINPATAITEQEENAIMPSGIGFWAIGVDFAVS